MSEEFASNTPISRPINLQNIKADMDFNGVMWSHVYGFMFEATDEMVPIRPPAPPRK